VAAVFSVEFACLDAMRSARSKFLDDIVAHSQRYRTSLVTADTSAEDVRVASLRNENVFHVAEFYFMCEHYRLNDPVRIAEFIDQHNDSMRELLNSGAAMRQRGLLAHRVKNAIFSEEQKAKVIETAVDKGLLRLDQSDIGRFLSPVISPETCRKTLVALAEGGLLERRNIGQVLVISTGVFEEYYRAHLRRIIDAIVSESDLKSGKYHPTLPGSMT
jgi:hypothetical protein